MSLTVSTTTPGVIAETAAARVSIAGVSGRLSLRARDDLTALESALGLSLSGKIGSRSEAQGVEALRVGPDEWVIISAPDQVAALVAAAAAVYDSHPHSLVDISGREITLTLSGARATEVLTLGMPRDPDSIAVGEGRRLLLDGVTVVLWRDGTDDYRIDVWHSFVPHLLGLLSTGTRELAADLS